MKYGIVEKVPDEYLTNQETSENYYLPHMAVIRKDRKTTKVRVVYDGSAKASKHEKSLNDCLQSPNHLPYVFNMLANFRKNLLGLTADIEKAFLMVGIQKDHQDFLRFLWFDDPSAERPNTIHLKFTKLVFGLRPSPAILGARILHHLEIQRKSDPRLIELLEKSFYVDDLLTGEDNDQMAFTIYKRAKKLMSEGGFNLRNWKTNSQQLQETINKEVSVTKSNSPNVSKDNNKTAVQSSTQDSNCNTSSDDDIFVKVLGMNWNTHSDEVIFNIFELTEYANSLPLTKRSILKFTSKIYDPMGFISPVTVKMKVLFQEMCIDKTNWDSELKGETLKK